MSRYSLGSKFALFQSVSAADPDATSSSTSSNSATNISSNSLSLSPSRVSSTTPTTLYEQQIYEPFKSAYSTAKQQAPNISKHLLELQREIKEEEEEIFADINSLINNRSNLYSSFDDDDTDDLCDNDQLHNHQDEKKEQYQQEPYKFQGVRELQEHQLGEHEHLKLQHEEHQFRQQHDGEDDGKQQHDSIEEEQHIETDDYRAIQRDIQQLTSNLPKPCVFFLEGNCRRSDCKYSHDLSSITCKYWIEGFCFKGEMCPFLHSFPPKDQDSGLPEDLALPKKELNPTFVIESEADFPSLPLDAPELNLIMGTGAKKKVDAVCLTKTIKNQILSSNPAVVFKTTKKKRKKG
jgi:hypothetical protein